MSNELKEKFNSQTPAEKAQFFRSLRELLADDGGDPEEAEFIANNMGYLLRDLDRIASYYDEVVRQEKSRAEEKSRVEANINRVEFLKKHRPGETIYCAHCGDPLENPLHRTPKDDDWLCYDCMVAVVDSNYDEEKEQEL
jgi:hypothetical protein